MTTRKLWTACGLLAALMFAANGCGESAPAPKQVAQTDKHDDHADHKDGDDHDHGKDGKKEGAEITLQLSDGSPATQSPSSGVGSANTTGAQNNTGSANTTGVSNWGGNNGGGLNLSPEDFGIRQEDIDNFRNDIRNLLGR